MPVTPSTRSGWRSLCAIALCGAAGAGLRWAIAGRSGTNSSPLDSHHRSSHASGRETPPPSPDPLPSLSPLDQLTSLAARLPDMTVAEIAPLVKTLIATCPEEAGYGWRYNNLNESPEPALLQMLFTRWAELDAPGMIATLSAPEFRHSVNVRFWAVSAWAELRGTAALQAVAPQWPGLATSAAWEMIQRQPGRCAELLPWLRNVSDFPISSDAMDALRKNMGTEDYVKLSMAIGHEGQVWGAIEDLSRRDAQRAMQIAKALPPGKFRDSALDTLFREMDGDYYGLFAAAGLNFRTEYEALPANSKVRQQRADDYAQLVLKEKGQEAALQWSRSLTDKSARCHALERIAAFLPENASAGDRTRLRAEAFLTYRPYDTSVISRDYKAWHTENPGAASEWLQTVTSATLRAALLRDVVSTPEEDLARFSSSGERLSYVRDTLFFPDQKSKAPAGTEEKPPLLTLDNIPEDLAHLAQLSAAVRTGVKDEAWAAANSDDRRFLSAEAMKYRVEHNNLDEVLKFFDAMAPEERSLGAWYEAGRAHVSKDTASASVWVNSLPPGAERDAAASALVESLTGTEWQGHSLGLMLSPINPSAERDTAAAFAWANSMNGEAERIQYVRQTARAWAVEDAAGARAAVTASSIPDGAKQSLLKELPEGGPR